MTDKPIPPPLPRWVAYMRLDEIRRAARNPNVHADDVIAASIDEFGFIEPMVMDERTATLLGGHGRLDYLERAHTTGADVPEGITVDDDGMWRAPVNRGWSSRDDDDAEAALVVLNEATRLGSWDRPQLAPMLAELRERKPSALAASGFGGDRLDSLLAEVRQTRAREANPEDVPTAPTEPVTRTGDLWQLGQHRLLCGDSFEPDQVDRLLDGLVADAVLTDPPYAIYGSASGISSDIADDLMVRPFFERLFAMVAPRVRDFAHVYVHCDWRSWTAVWLGATRAKLHPKNCIVWDKGGAGLGANWANTHEFIGYFAKLPPQPAMTSGAKRGQRTVYKSNILRHPRASGDDREHNAAKPVALLGEVIEVATDPGQLVLDLFGGSGSTLIAAETVGRRCYMMETKPEWCDVIAARYERVTGTPGQRIPAE